jgi:alpha-beta hydrolase superfamily lysophospholipase
LYATILPSSVGVRYENVSFQSRVDHIRLSGWYMPAKGSQRTVVIVHGYAEYRLNESASLPVAKALVEHGFNVLTFDFRGCGDSGNGTVTLGQNEPRDLLGAIDWLHRQPGQAQARIGVLGFSLGATTALESGAADPADIRAIVSDSAFADLYDFVLQHADHWTHLPAIPFNRLITWVTPALTGMNPKNVNAVAAVQHMPHTALFFIAGTADTTIPNENTEELYQEAATARKTLWLVPNGTHAESYKQQPAAYTARVVAFFERYV